MKFRLIWVGSNADAELGPAIERYCSRIKHFFPIEILELEGAKRGRQSERDGSIIRDHSARLLAAIPNRGYTVVLDEREPWLLGEDGDVGAPAGDQAVDGDDLVTPGDERLAHEAADEAGTAGHDHPHVRPGRRRDT